MTDQQSLDDISMLLMRYPGISSARGFQGRDCDEVSIFFRCEELTSLEEISFCAYVANVEVVVGVSSIRMGFEPEDVSGLQFIVKVAEDIPPTDPSTRAEIFGVFLACGI